MQTYHSALRTLTHHRSQAQNSPPKFLAYDLSLVIGRPAAQLSVNGLELSRTTCTQYVGFALIIRKIEGRSSFVVARCRVPTARFDLTPSQSGGVQYRGLGCAVPGGLRSEKSDQRGDNISW